jgi:hypothetical protein
MSGLAFRARLAWWAFRNPDTLTMLHFEMLRDAGGLGPKAFRARHYAMRLDNMPGARENRAAL